MHQGTSRKRSPHLGLRSIHIRDCHWLKKFCSNNGHERFNWELADILDRIRGIRDPESHLFKLIILHHNFIRPHMGLAGRCPPPSASRSRTRRGLHS